MLQNSIETCSSDQMLEFSIAFEIRPSSAVKSRTSVVNMKMAGRARRCDSSWPSRHHPGASRTKEMNAVEKGWITDMHEAEPRRQGQLMLCAHESRESGEASTLHIAT